MTDDERIVRALTQADGYCDLELYDRALEVLASLEDFGGHVHLGELIAGNALRGLQRFSEAATHLERALRHEPGSVPARVCLGWCYKRMGRLKDGIRVLEEAYRKGTRETIIPFNLACYYALAGQVELSLACLREAIARDAECVELARRDADFDPIRHLPEFCELVDD